MALLFIKKEQDAKSLQAVITFLVCGLYKSFHNIKLPPKVFLESKFPLNFYFIVIIATVK